MDEERIYLVYMHRNKKNGKVYIGLTRNTWESRWKTKYKNNKHFHAAIENTTEDDWEHIVVADNLTKDEAGVIESDLIFKYKAKDPKHGYNKSWGGEGTMSQEEYQRQLGIYGSQSYHEKLSRAMKRVWEERTPEEKLRISKAQSKLQKKRMKETPKEIVAERTKKGKETARINREAKKAELQKRLENDPEFAIAYYAKKEERLLEQRERERERRKIYAEAHKRDRTEEELEEIQAKRSKAMKEIWERPGYREMMSQKISEALKSEEYRKTVSEYMKEQWKSPEMANKYSKSISGGMKRKWEEGHFSGNKGMKIERLEETNSKIGESLSSRSGKPVYCKETGETYRSIKDAARKTGCNAKELKLVLNGKRKSVHGFHFEYAGNDTTKDPRISVLCVETGKVYESMKEAYEDTGVCVSSISCCCKGTRVSAGGYHWKYVA